MPPPKPSPHRFIPPAPDPKPKSTLRHAITAHPPDPQFEKITPAKRFVLAPPQHQHLREANSGTPRASRAADAVEVPSASLPGDDATPRPRARRLERVESIEDAASSPSRAVRGHVDERGNDVVQTVEHGAVVADEDARNDPDHDEDGDELLFETARAAKRRRTAPPSPTLRPAAPQTPAAGAAAHRFRFAFAAASKTPAASAATSARASANTTSTSTSTSTPRPHFILPAPRAPAPPSAPLPDVFSPSRKAQKYTPHGLASSVQAWIIEAAQQGAAAGMGWGREQEEGVRVKIRVLDIGGREEVECWPGVTTFVVGETEPGMYNASRAEGVAGGQGVRVLLAGQGGARGSAGVRMRVGSVFGIRAPTWELDVDGEKWTVGVDWLVLH